MQFSDTSLKQGLIEDVTFWTGADTNKFPLADRTRSINEWYRTVWSWIFEAYGGFLFIDDNISYASGSSNGLPYADLDFNSGTALVDLPSNALTVVGFEMRTIANGPLEPLTVITHEEFLDMGGDAAFPSTGTPIYALFQGGVVRPLPTPNFTLTSAARVYFDPEIATFVAGDTIRAPGFVSTFHRVLSIGASRDYGIGRITDKKVAALSGLLLDYEKRIKGFYSKRLKARQPNKLGGGQSDLVSDNS